MRAAFFDWQTDEWTMGDTVENSSIIGDVDEIIIFDGTDAEMLAAAKFVDAFREEATVCISESVGEIFEMDLGDFIAAIDYEFETTVAEVVSGAALVKFREL